MHYALGTLDTAISIRGDEIQIGSGKKVVEFERIFILEIDDEEYRSIDYPWMKSIDLWVHDSASIDVDCLRTILIDADILTL